nr:PREDICTED: uncharacterized protein LOC103281007 isoform X1 [Anolis carolinensis]|eukprot:XP_008119819.1 PREDICTED: uncharacterized protein LOC103281007 isoform X1 [Anolis carolinensis]
MCTIHGFLPATAKDSQERIHPDTPRPNIQNQEGWQLLTYNPTSSHEKQDCTLASPAQLCPGRKSTGRSRSSAWRTSLGTCSASGPRITQTTTWMNTSSATSRGPSANWNLTSLNLHGCSRVPTDALVDLIEGLPGLTMLDLSGTQCNTQVLSAVGSTCRRLRELDISDCKKLSPASLFHLAYDPIASAFCCPALQTLEVDGMESSPRCDDLPWALAYLLLALPNLIVLENETTTDAVCLIHDRDFSGAQVPPGFPTMEEVVKRWVSLHPSRSPSQLKLPLKKLLEVSESYLSVVLAVCPHLAKVTVNLEESSVLARRLLPWGSLTSLSLDCNFRRLEELLPVTARLGTQLETLSLDGFSLDDEVSLHVLLSHCPNLQIFSASLYHLKKDSPGEEALAQVASLPPFSFPQLQEFTLTFSDVFDAKDPPEALGLTASLVSLLKGSPRLQIVMLIGLPFSLDRVFEEVLGPPGTTAVFLHLIELSLIECKVSSSTIHQILSLENPLNSLDLDRCPDIYRKDYEELLRRVSREGLEMRIEWK